MIRYGRAMTTRAWVGTCLLLAMLGCRDRVDAADEARKVRPGSTDDATSPLVDEGFRFRLAWPGAGWKVLRAADARRLNRDAVAGLMHKDVVAIVIVEPLPGLEREGYTQLVIDNLALADKRSSVEVRAVDGHDESRIVVTGTQDGRPTTVRGRLFAYQGHGYQILTIQLGDAPPAAIAGRAIDAFSLIDGPVTGHLDATATGDLDGLGWRLRGDRLEHGPAAMRVTVPDGWQVIPDGDLGQMNHDAALGLRAPRDSMYLTVISEPVHGVKAAEYLASRRAALGEIWTADGDPAPMTVGRAPIEMHRVRGEIGFAAEMLWGAVVVGSRGYQLSIWYPRATGAQLRPRVPALLAAIEFLDERTTAALTAELAAVPPRAVAVGADFALRGGTYHDFTHRLRWHQPRGLWRVTVGDDARAINSAIQLQAEDTIGGTYAQLIAEAWTGDLAGLETAVRASLTSPITAHGATTVRGRPARYLEWLVDTGGMRLRMRDTLVVADGRSVQVMTWALADAWPSAAALTEIVDGLELLDALPETEPGTPYRDHRYGFEVTLPAGWTANEQGSVRSPNGVVRRWSRGVSELLVLANYAPNSDDEFMIEMAEQNFRQHMATLVDVAPKREAIELAGRPGTRLTWSSARGRAELQLVRRGDLMYGVLAVAPEGGAAIAVGRAALTLLE